MAAATRQSVESTIAAAAADRDLAAQRRDAGRATDADVLLLDVQLARGRQQAIRAASDEEVARARLNQAIGEPLDAVFVFEPVQPVAGPTRDAATLETEALGARLEVRASALQAQLAQTTVSSARAAFLPQVSTQLGWEMNGGQWDSRSPSWIVGVVASVNLFRGFADRARLAEAEAQVSRRALEREQVETAVRLEVRVATARLEAARASVAVGRAAVEQARESQRIVRDRYEAGLMDVTALLRAGEAVLQAETQQTVSAVELVMAGAALDRAVGQSR
jgi:outer membrane protein TolC